MTESNKTLTLDLSFYENSVVSFLLFIEKFRNEFLAKFSSIQSTVLSLLNTPQCSCRYTLIEFIKNNSLDIIQFSRDFFDKNEDHKFEMVNFASQSKFIEVSGTVEIIDDTPESWKNFYRKVVDSNYRFNTFNILKDEDKIKIYFL